MFSDPSRCVERLEDIDFSRVDKTGTMVRAHLGHVVLSVLHQHATIAVVYRSRYNLDASWGPVEISLQKWRKQGRHFFRDKDSTFRVPGAACLALLTEVEPLWRAECLAAGANPDDPETCRWRVPRTLRRDQGGQGRSLRGRRPAGRGEAAEAPPPAPEPSSDVGGGA